MSVTQDNRIAGLTTPLGANKLLLAGCRISEQLGRPFRIEMDLFSEDPAINFADMIGQKVGLKLVTADEGQPRYFHGVVSKFVQTGEGEEISRYRATVVPWLWFLTRTSDCRIFQNMTAPEIIKKVLAAKSLGDFEDALTKSYPTREFCVQYRETDFNFVSRMMEAEGIYYFFEHAGDKHTLVLADSKSAHQPFPGYAELNYHTRRQGETGSERVLEWTVEQELQPGSCVLNDFDFKAPTKALKMGHGVARDHTRAAFEVYDYPGEYTEPDEGKHYAQVRIEEFAAQHHIARARSDARGVCTGCTFNLTGHPREDQAGEYLVTGAEYRIDNDPFIAGGAAGGHTFTSHFTAIPADQPFRPTRITPKPTIQGPQTAIVVGKKGEEIWTDKFGRVKLHFHWHRHDESNENSSCWVRVAQVWAGAKWGAMHIPRMGQEVVVEFLEGDPDRPLITGRVYNGDLLPPYDLPGNMTQSGVKSRSTKGGGPDHFNEIRMEDKKGEEQLYIHAEKNQDIVVENDETHSVGHNRTKTVGNDESTTIGNNRTESVGSNETITIGSNRTEQVGANEAIAVGGSRTRTVGCNETVTVALLRTHTVGVNEAITVGAAQEITVGGAQATTVGAARSVAVGGNQSTDVGGNRSASVGKTDSLKVGKKLVIDAGDEVLIKTGEASILMKKDGTIQIKGKDVTVNGSGAIALKASKDVTIKGSTVKTN